MVGGELHPQDGNSWANLGTACCQAKKWQEARAALEKADGFKDENCDHCFHLAMACWELGDKGEARRHLERAMTWTEKKKPNDKELRKFRKQAEMLMGIDSEDG